MTYLETLLKASIDMSAKDKEIAALNVIAAELRKTVALQLQRIASLEGSARRSTTPFKRDQIPALLRPQAG